MSKQTANHIVDSYYDNGFNPNRKIRNDKGLTLVNSDKKRKSTYTPLYVYKREQTHKRFRTNTLRLDANEIKTEFFNKCDDERIVYKNITNNFVKQGFSLHHNTIKSLEKSSGNMIYNNIANH